MKSLAVCLLGLLVLVACDDDGQPTASVDLTGPTAAGKALTDADATRAGTADLGDITDLREVQSPTNTLKGGDDAVAPLKAAQSRKPTKPEFVNVQATPEQVNASWSASTPPSDCTPACTISGYQVTFRALARSGTNATFNIGGNMTSGQFDVDAGYYWIFVRAQASNGRWSSSDWWGSGEIVEVPEATTISEPEPPAAPQLNPVAVQSSDWTCNANEYCSLSYSVNLNGETGYEAEWERRISPSGVTETGTVTLNTSLDSDIPVGGSLWLRARQRADSNSPWSAWREHQYTATAESAAQSNASRTPGAVTNLTAAIQDGGYLLSFTFTEHGGLPVESFQWGPTTFDQGCNDPIFPYQSLQALNQNAQQSFQVWAGGDAISVRPVNAKGAGSCATIESPDSAPRFGHRIGMDLL